MFYTVFTHLNLLTPVCFWKKFSNYVSVKSLTRRSMNLAERKPNLTSSQNEEFNELE